MISLYKRVQYNQRVIFKGIFDPEGYLSSFLWLAVNLLASIELKKVASQ